MPPETTAPKGTTLSKLELHFIVTTEEVTDAHGIKTESFRFNGKLSRKMADLLTAQGYPFSARNKFLSQLKEWITEMAQNDKAIIESQPTQATRDPLDHDEDEEEAEFFNQMEALHAEEE